MKTSSILVCPVIALRNLPPNEVDVIRRFLFDHIRGMDAKNDKRWRRLWGRVWKAEPGEGFPIYDAEQRSGPFHRRHRIILERLFNAQERYRNIDALHDHLKIKAYFVDWGEGKRGLPVMVPRTTSFPECSENDMREFHNAMVDVLHSPAEQKHLWPHLSAPMRAEMLESVLNNPEEQQQ
jgi:hypothetical protein